MPATPGPKCLVPTTCAWAGLAMATQVRGPRDNPLRPNRPLARSHPYEKRDNAMTLLLIIIVVLLLLGGGGGYYGYRTYGGPGLGGALGLVLVVILLLWLFGGLGGVHHY